jgi:phage/plasmid-associated DNA primase
VAAKGDIKSEYDLNNLYKIKYIVEPMSRDAPNCAENPVSDSEDDSIDDPIKSVVALRIQESTNLVLRAFRTFLSEPAFINNVGDGTTTIVDRTYKKCYNIPERKISRFFRFLEVCRRKPLKMSMYEKQLEYSGIMLDFDIFQTLPNSQLTAEQFHRLSISVIKILVKHLQFDDSYNEIVVGFICKPKVVANEQNINKDGFHMLIPGIKITRSAKKLLINQMLKDKVMDRCFHDLKPHPNYTLNDFVDVNSAHVGVHFIGSSSKPGKPPYELTHVFKVKVDIKHEDYIPYAYDIIGQANADSKINLCYEFSLNWERSPAKGGIIAKKQYEVKAEYAFLLETDMKKPDDLECEDEFEPDSVHGEMSLLNVHDPDTQYIKSLLDILHIDRATDYDLWFQVLCVLAHASPTYKPLAEYFSRRVPEKFDPVAFENTWNSAVKDTKNNLTMGSLHYWAQHDNPDRYEEVRQRSVYTMIYKKIYDIQTEGILEHYDIAELLYKMLKHKYVFDKEEGALMGCWYEFIIENEPQRKGEMFKWRKYDTRKPPSLMRYVSEILPNLFRKVIDRIKATYEESADDLAKYHRQILTNVQRTSRSLKNSGFKRGVITEAEFIFEKIGFAEDLDTNPLLKGVGNGVLLLGREPKLITGYHGHKISKFTPVDYIKMNPYNPKTKKLLLTLRNLIPDIEPDTFNYIMHYLASTLDGRKKESIMLLIVGGGSNGKSFMVELHKGAIGSIDGVKMPISFLTTQVKNSENATPALMQLKDARFAYYSESNKSEVLNIAKIKEFTGQETLAGRNLNQGYINFKPKCHHLVASNNDFEIHEQDHGAWRRIKYFRFKIKFCDPAVDEYDPENPYERIADPEVGSNWTEDPEILALYLGIMVWYYASLQENYGGKVQNVPHPHIKKETEEFRNRQDTLNCFINTYLVKCDDDKQEIPISDTIEKYCTWFTNMYPDNNSFKKGLVEQIENSLLQKFMKKTRRGRFLVGYRILGQNEEKEDGEVYYSDLAEDGAASALICKPETSEEFYARICREYDSREASAKPDVPVKKGVDLKKNETFAQEVDSDSDVEIEIKKVEATQPKKKLAAAMPEPKQSARNATTGLAAAPDKASSSKQTPGKAAPNKAAPNKQAPSKPPDMSAHFNSDESDSESESD